MLDCLFSMTADEIDRINQELSCSKDISRIISRLKFILDFLHDYSILSKANDDLSSATLLVRDLTWSVSDIGSNNRGKLVQSLFSDYLKLT